MTKLLEMLTNTSILKKYHSPIVELNEPNSMIAPKHIISMKNDFHDSRAWRS